MNAALVVAAGLLGLLIGSFLNVVVWRVPRGESIVRPASSCPRCGHLIRRRDNIPVVSWLALRGRCRDCSAPISVRYPAVELGTGVAFAAVTAWAGAVWTLPGYLYLAALTVCLSVIDIEHHRLPDSIVLAAYPVTLALLVLAAVDPGGEAQWPRLLTALAGGAVLLALYALLWFVYPKGMGFGDVKLAGVVGLFLGWCGWGAVVVGGFAAFLLGGVFGIALMVAGRAGRKAQVPFGPWMLLGGWVGLTLGQATWSAYLGVL